LHQFVIDACHWPAARGEVAGRICLSPEDGATRRSACTPNACASIKTSFQEERAVVLKFREDPDLSFLRFAKHEDLKSLARLMTHDTDDETRWAQALLEDERYKTNHNDLRLAWQAIAAELQLFGGDSVVNLVRGTGVPYREILTDVCGKLDVKIDAKDVATDEKALMDALVERFLAKASDAERATLMAARDRMTAAEFRKRLFTDSKFAMLTSQILATVVSQGLLRGGAVAIAEAMGVRALTALVPGMAIAAAPAVVSLMTGPAYRITTCCVMQIAYMRLVFLNRDHYE
jgi:uncharacterized protein YaaW (UPF0174 family)